MPTGPKLFAEAEERRTEAAMASSHDERMYQLGQALVAAVQANTAAVVMHTETTANAGGVDNFELDSWTKVVTPTPFTECKGKEWRRPACEERHTEDCQYADPPTPAPEPVKQEPTGPRVYVENQRGKQGHVVDVSSMNGTLMFRVQWYVPGAEPVWKAADTLTIIPTDQVTRCGNDQTRDECTEIDPCESCQQDIDAEGDAMEESMCLR